jgi:hypothetical protein
MSVLNKIAFLDSGQKKIFGGLFFYYFLAVFIFFALYFFDVFSTLPDRENLLKWDAAWYLSIKEGGYAYYWYMASNSAFFPLFSYFWKLTHLNGLGISFVNLLLFIAGAYYIARQFSFNLAQVLVFVSIPSGIFFFLPYTESLFFFFSALFLVGLHTRNTKLIIIGLLFCSLTRATVMFFIPSIILMELFCCEKIFDKKALKNILLYSAVGLLGLGLVVLFQYSQTYEWFAFAKQQFKFWKHHFSWPTFPLVSHGGEKILWIDGLAFLFGICATFLLLVYFIKKMMGKQSELFSNRAFWFSACYVFMVTVYSLFFNSKCLDAQTSIDSINRYMFSTAFFMVFLIYALNYFRFDLRNSIVFFFLCLLSFILLGLGGPTLFFLDKAKLGEHATVLFFLMILVYVTMYFLTSWKKYGNYIAFSLVALNALLTAYLFHSFLIGTWIA